MKNIFFTTLTLLFFLSCTNKKKENTYKPKTTLTVDWSNTNSYYKTYLTEALNKLKVLKTLNPKDEKAKQLFKEIRIAFKKAEPLASHLNPQTGHRVNGPALPIYKADNNKVIAPVGLQKIEESIFDGENLNTFISEIDITIGLLKILNNNLNRYKLDSRRFFIATHQQLLRIITHSITGFDTPVSNFGINEAKVSLESLSEVYTKSIQNIIITKDQQLNKDFINNITNAISFLNKNNDFKSFDRYTFIRNHLNPILKNWISIRKTTKLWEPKEINPINFDAPTFFEKNSFNKTYFITSTNRKTSKEIIDFGKKLFFNKKLSNKGTMSCATCHLPEKAYSDGLALGIDNNGNKLQRNSPSLINSIYQKSFFLDGRVETLESQISEVFNNKKEFNNSIHQFAKNLVTDSAITNPYKKLYKKELRYNSELVKPISSFVSTLTGINSRFDKNISGKLNDYTEEEKLGFNLFAGKALCATCHFLPLTNGTVPPFFKETEKEVIGVPETASNKKLDDDNGFYWRYQHPSHKGMFKTPTVRNITKTAPYMHNGVYTTLKQVIDFYNKGGGRGLGFDLPHQTLPFDNLELNQKEQKAIIAFLKTLDDTDISESY